MGKGCKVQKKEYKRARRKSHGLWKFLTWFCGILAVILTVAMVIVSTFDNTLALVTGGSFWKLENEDPDAQYYTPEYVTEEDVCNSQFRCHERHWEGNLDKSGFSDYRENGGNGYDGILHIVCHFPDNVDYKVSKIQKVRGVCSLL